MSSVLEEKEAARPWALSTPAPFPAVAMKVFEILGKEEAEVKQVVRWIQRDPVFASELLRVANSALYGSACEIRSVQHATVKLGLDFVKALAITVGLRAYVKSSMKLPVLRRCWTHSLACALVSQELATACSVKTDDAYTAGLLHDIGRLGLLAAYPVEYANVLSVALEHSFDVLHCERELFDLDHCEAGAWLARQWRLPAELAAIAAHHHDEPAGATDPVDLMRIVQLGCRLADTLDFSVIETRRTWTVEQIRSRLPEAAQLRFTPDLEALQAKVAEQIQALD